MTNPYHHALDTKRIALNDNGLLAWVKHNMSAIMESLKVCNQLQNLNQRGFTHMQVEVDNLPIPNTDIPVSGFAYSPALDFDAEGRN